MIEIPRDIHEFIAELGIDFSRSSISSMQKLYSILLEGNSISNLTRVTDLQDYWQRHIVDSLLILKEFPELLTVELKIADVGCGGGFPILPLAWACPNLQIVGIEARGKKTTFVESAAKKLGLSNVSVLNMQAREAGRSEQFTASFNIVMLRAVGTTGKMLKECKGLIKTSLGSKMISYKTPASAAEELQLAQREAKKFGFEYVESKSYTLPGEGDAGDRLFVSLIRK